MQRRIGFIKIMIVCISWLVSLSAHADLSILETFSSRDRADSGGLVWNTAQERVHAPLFVSQYLDGTRKDLNFAVGDESHGSFDPSTYGRFSVGGNLSGQVIRFDSAQFPVLKVSRFILAAGWFIQPVGDLPFLVQSTGDVLIDGVIDCKGGYGEALNNDPAVATVGGQGRCGGGDGGSGASQTSAATSGAIGGPLITNGAGVGVDGPTVGVAGGLESGGGGGGAYAVSRGVGFDPTSGSGASGGLRGEMGRDNDFTYTGGGFGGGGGGFYNSGLSTENSAGGGGGGGGGSVFITSAGSISITGQVLADGGDGGSSSGSLRGGGGGGGGGGSIALFAGGEVYLSGGAVVSAAGGVGLGPVGTKGGDGSAGRTWLVGHSGYSILVPPQVNPEYPDPLVTDVGLVRYQLGTFTLASAAIDVGNSHPRLDSVSTTSTLPGGSTLTVNISSGADSAFTPAWTSAATLPQELSRFMKFQLVLVNASISSQAYVDQINFDFTGRNEENFQFTTCGGSGSTPAGSSFLFAVPGWIYLLLRRRARLRP